MQWFFVVLGIAGFIALELQLVRLTERLERMEKERDAWKLAAESGALIVGEDIFGCPHEDPDISGGGSRES